MKKKNIIYTIGHSTHSLEEFINILKHYHISHLVDIRTIPGSKFNPQFNKENLEKELKKEHIAYTHLKKLGGLRHTKTDSVNMGWKNKSFRGYADYMQTTDFNIGLKELIDFTKQNQVAIMCAEAVPWRCHRLLVGDALLVRRFTVIDIFSLASTKLHTLTPWAQVQGETITYPVATE